MIRVVALILVVFAFVTADAQAQVKVIREGEENPVLTVAKSTLWGGLTGLVLGGAIALVAEDNEEDIVKWSFVAGTFGGFAYGLYHVATRQPPTTSLLEMDADGLALGIPTVGIGLSADGVARRLNTSITVFSYTF